MDIDDQLLNMSPYSGGQIGINASPNCSNISKDKLQTADNSPYISNSRWSYGDKNQTKLFTIEQDADKESISE